MRTPWGENLEAHGCASKCRESTGMCEAASLSAIQIKWAPSGALFYLSRLKD